MGVLRNWFFVWFFVCFGFRVFLGFCGWVPEALCNPAQMRTQDGPAFRGSRVLCTLNELLVNFKEEILPITIEL